MGYAIHEVDPHGSADAIHYFNSLSDLFPPLQPRHLNDGYWWIVFNGPGHIVGFAGLVPFEPFENIGYLTQNGHQRTAKRASFEPLPSAAHLSQCSPVSKLL